MNNKINKWTKTSNNNRKFNKSKRLKDHRPIMPKIHLGIIMFAISEAQFCSLPLMEWKSEEVVEIREREFESTWEKDGLQCLLWDLLLKLNNILESKDRSWFGTKIKSTIRKTKIPISWPSLCLNLLSFIAGFIIGPNITGINLCFISMSMEKRIRKVMPIWILEPCLCKKNIRIRTFIINSNRRSWWNFSKLLKVSKFVASNRDVTMILDFMVTGELVCTRYLTSQFWWVFQRFSSRFQGPCESNWWKMTNYSLVFARPLQMDTKQYKHQKFNRK